MIREIPLRALGREYTFRLGINAICRFEKEAGMAITSIDLSKLEMRTIRALIWAGLKDQHKDVSLDLAGDIIDDLGLNQIMQLVPEALNATFPPVDPDAIAGPRTAVGNGAHS